MDLRKDQFNYIGYIFFIFLLSCHSGTRTDEDHFSFAQSRKNDLRLSVYITAQAVDQLLSSETGRREALSVLRANGITKVYVEVYRGGLVVSNDLLKLVTGYFRRNGFEVVGGIATVPGDDFGLAQEARFKWFNWQNVKTQNDLKNLMQNVSPLFDSFIVDDFLCTSDTSAESKAAKSNSTWSQYRRNLLVDFAEKFIIDPAKKTNPEIKMIIKYPQWYDRYHLFGYDVARQPALFDMVWIGTETRGQYTKSFGYVQPYEGFINYRWMASLSGGKMGGAWFDHIDCDENDFIDQAYQSVLAGAKELILFNYFNLVEGHPGQHILRLEFNYLADLAVSVARTPVYGISAYKPPNSDAGGDLYIMDYIGMFGVPVMPCSQYPENADILFLPAQAAADTSIYNKVKLSLDHGARIIMTSGFLNHAPKGQQFAKMAGIAWPIDNSVIHTNIISVNNQPVRMDSVLAMGANIKLSSASMELGAFFKGKEVAYLCRNKTGNIYVLNSHTFSDTDFNAIGEILLCPRPLGMLEVPQNWANAIRNAFNGKTVISMDAPVRITFQPFGNEECMIQNYNRHEAIVKINLTNSRKFKDVISGKVFPVTGDVLQLNMPARSRIWLKPDILKN